MKILALVIISIVAAGSIGTSYALITHGEAVQINGDLNLVQGSFNSLRTDGNDLANGMANSGGANVFQFFDVDDNQVYRMKLLGDGSEFVFQDFTHANRKDIVIQTATGNIGVG